MKMKDITVGVEYAFAVTRSRKRGLEEDGLRVRVLEMNMERVEYHGRTTVKTFTGIRVQHLDKDTGEEEYDHRWKTEGEEPKKKEDVISARQLNMLWAEYEDTIRGPHAKQKEAAERRITTHYRSLKAVVEALGLPDGSYELVKGFSGHFSSRKSLLHIDGKGARAILKAIENAKAAEPKLGIINDPQHNMPGDVGIDPWTPGVSPRVP